MLEQLHSDCAKVVWKFDRWHHFVDYNQFKKNQLKRKAGWNYNGVNNYEMKLVETKR
jgi:hypothetical protein